MFLGATRLPKNIIKYTCGYEYFNQTTPVHYNRGCEVSTHRFPMNNNNLGSIPARLINLDGRMGPFV